MLKVWTLFQEYSEISSVIICHKTILYENGTQQYILINFLYKNLTVVREKMKAFIFTITNLIEHWNYESKHVFYKIT